MAVQFILGRSGTGKTRYCIEAITRSLVDSKQTHPLVFLVPEQATYQAERAILSQNGIAGYNRLHVLSFSRLEFILHGRFCAGAELSRIAQQLVIHRILWKNAKSLRIFGISARHPGLAAQLARTIIELHQYGHTPQSISDLAQKLNKKNPDDLASLKWSDIALLYSEYLAYIEGTFVNPDIQLSNACKLVGNSEFLRDAHLWVDGFSGFTEQELAMLRELLKVTTQSHIALCLDPGLIDFDDTSILKLNPLSIFNPTERTWSSLMEIIKKNKLLTDKPLILQKSRRFQSVQLQHIEQNLFKDESPQIGKNDSVEIIAAANTRAEVDYVARRIMRLVRERRWRFRDIAVVASDLGEYRHYIQAAFDDCQIPFFLDIPKPVNQHPLVELIVSAIAVVLNGFQTADIIAFLKTDLSPLTRDETDVVENYCLAYGIQANDWKQKGGWKYVQRRDCGFDEKQIDELRRKAAAPLVEFENKFRDKKAVPAAMFRKAIGELLEMLQINGKISTLFKNSDEQSQFNEQFIGFFNEFAQIFSSDVMHFEDIAVITIRAFEQMSLRLIPPSLDQVLVGSIERSRHPDLKAIFLLGASQKQFPVPVKFDNILTDEDRTKADSMGFQFSPNTSIQLAQRQYLVYIAFTRPSDMLCVSFPMADKEGSAVPPSSFVSNLQWLFTDLRPRIIGYGSQELQECTNSQELADLLCQKLGDDFGSQQAQMISPFLKSLCDDDELAPLCDILTKATNYTNKPVLQANFVKAFSNSHLKSSVTKLCSFASCPYQFFAKYTLKIKERDIYSFEPPDLGVFYHKILSEFYKRLKREKLELASIQDKNLLKYLDATIAAVVSEDTYYTGFVSRSRFNRYIIENASEVLEDFVIDAAKIARAGHYRQIDAEHYFEFTLPLAAGRELILNGFIDRIDANHDSSVIFDFKTSEKSFDWAKYFHALDLQLAFYLLAAQAEKFDGKNLDPQGAFYLAINSGTEKGSLDSLECHSGKQCRKAKGFFNGEIAQQLDKSLNSGTSEFYNFGISQTDGHYGWYNHSGALRPEHFHKMLEFAKCKIKELANRIFEGEIAIKPYRLGGISPCTGCKIRPLCRFDWRINDYNFMQPMNKLAVLEKIGGSHAV